MTKSVAYLLQLTILIVAGSLAAIYYEEGRSIEEFFYSYWEVCVGCIVMNIVLFIWGPSYGGHHNHRSQEKERNDGRFQFD